jgi:hypothetical protein
MRDDTWEKVWTKNLITSDYSLKYLAFICCVAQMIMSARLRFIRYPVLIKNNGKEQALG